MPKIEDRKGTDRIISVTKIIHHENGALEVQGPVEDKVYMLALLENAKDAVRNHRNPGAVDIIIPGKDVSIEGG